MKSFVAVVIFLASSVAFADSCPDFSGYFQTMVEQGDPSAVTVQQTGCDRLDIVYFYRDGQQMPTTVYADNVARPVFETYDMIVVVAAKWEGDTLIETRRTFNKFTGETYWANAKSYLNSERDLVTESTFFNSLGQPGQTLTSVYKRK